MEKVLAKISDSTKRLLEFVESKGKLQMWLLKSIVLPNYFIIIKEV
jgi:hypothetical protein